MTLIEQQEPDGATPLGPDEKAGLLHTHVETRDELNELESANIMQGLAWAGSLRNVTVEQVMNRDFIEELHSRLFGEVWSWAGKYRTRELNIGCDPIYIGPNLHNLLEDIKTWIEFDHFSPLELSARVQHGLVKIHPFPNGNGRHSRIVTDCLRILVLGLPRMKWAAGNLEQQNEERRQYIHCLRKADGGDFAPFVAHLAALGNK
ncbi:MAG: Fic-DOC domain mobile mystery protein B [Glaciecola sp.]|jgi:Fic-DOC domain mobile mystery protein B